MTNLLIVSMNFIGRDRTTNFIVIIADTKKYLQRKQEVIDDDIKKVYWLMTSITLVRMLADSFGSLIYEQYKSQLFVVNQSINFG